MESPDFPDDEDERIAVLLALSILDSAPEERFDRITRIAKNMFKVPIALVSLVDTDRQWFKSRQGLDAEETSREISFCGHAILQHRILEIPNALDDERFADNPLVTGPPNIRFYAGIPITVREGFRIGTLCIIDTEPRELSEGDKYLLTDLGKMVEAEIAQMDLVEITEQLHESQLEAQRANQAKSMFLSNMSHELRTPLNAILGFGQLLEFPHLAEAKRKEAVAQILKAGDHLLDLINDILDLSKIESGVWELSIEPLSMTSVCNDCLEIAQALASKKDIQIHESGIENLHVYSDRIRLKQVMLNLLSNAIKYNREGGQVILSVEPAELANEIIISIEDTGFGIKEEDVGKLFDPFERLGEEYKGTEGTGIGLTITRSLIEQMGGQLQVESKPGVGSRFWFNLPSAVDDENKALLQEALDSDTFVQVTDRQHLVLYIEDNPANLKFMTDVFEIKQGVDMRTAHTASLGVELAEVIEPDLILLDINLPDIDGFDLLKMLRANEKLKDIPVFAVSALATRADKQKGMEAGFNEYVTKPIRVSDFLDLLERYLGSGV